jgi:hypothetical protein
MDAVEDDGLLRMRAHLVERSPRAVRLAAVEHRRVVPARATGRQRILKPWPSTHY